MEDVVLSRLGDELKAEGAHRMGSNWSFTNPRFDEIVESEVIFMDQPDRDSSTCPSTTKLVNMLRENTEIKLMEFQIQAILNTVYRPDIINIERCIRRKNGTTSQKFKVSADVVAGRSDIGSCVVNDLMSGSGKTIMAAIAGIYFALHRSEEVMGREEILIREQRPMNWSSKLGANDTPRSYMNSVIIMTSDKVVAQWEEAVHTAFRLMSVSSYGVHRNPTRDTVKDDIDGEENTESLFRDAAWNVKKTSASVFIFTSSSNLSRFFPEDDGFVPCVIVDEYAQKSVHNIVTRASEETPIYGRLLLVSADAADTSVILLNSRKTSLIRTTVATGYVENNGNLKLDNRLATALLACSVLSSQEREEAHNELLSMMNRSKVEKYRILFDSPTWDTYSFDMDTHLRKSGIHGSSAIENVPDLVDVVSYADISGSLRSKSDFLQKELKKVSTDDCSVCFECLNQKEKVSMLYPCWHVFCKKCTSNFLGIAGTCPVCREVVKCVKDLRTRVLQHKDAVPEGSKFDTFVKAHLPQNPTATEVCSALLRGSADALRAGIPDPIKRLLIVSHSTKFGLVLQKSLEREYREIVEIVQLKVESNKRKRTCTGFEAQLEWFKEQDDKIKVMCTHENVGFTNDVLGLDFYYVDSICHIGGGTTARRLGRITRMQRALNKGITVRLFDLVPS